MTEEQIIRTISERPNSFELGKATRRFKIYFNDAQDLKNQIEELKKNGILKDEDLQ